MSIFTWLSILLILILLKFIISFEILDKLFCFSVEWKSRLIVLNTFRIELGKTFYFVVLCCFTSLHLYLVKKFSIFILCGLNGAFRKELFIVLKKILYVSRIFQCIFEEITSMMFEWKLNCGRNMKDFRSFV